MREANYNLPGRSRAEDFTWRLTRYRRPQLTILMAIQCMFRMHTRVCARLAPRVLMSSQSIWWTNPTDRLILKSRVQSGILHLRSSRWLGGIWIKLPKVSTKHYTWSPNVKMLRLPRMSRYRSEKPAGVRVSKLAIRLSSTCRYCILTFLMRTWHAPKLGSLKAAIRLRQDKQSTG